MAEPSGVSSIPWFDWRRREHGIERILAERVEARVFNGHLSQLLVVRMEPNTAGEAVRYNHEQWRIVHRGHAVAVVGGREFPVGPGDFWLCPANTVHAVYTMDEPCTMFEVMVPPREALTRAGDGYD